MEPKSVVEPAQLPTAMHDDVSLEPPQATTPFFRASLSFIPAELVFSTDVSYEIGLDGSCLAVP